MQIISVNIQKGGCAKTTSVQVLAELLNTQHGKRVLCIDTDPQCNLTIVSGIDLIEYQDYNLYKLLKDECTIEQCIVPTKYYDIIPGSILLSGADAEFNRTGREFYLKEKISKLNYDVILIDTPPALGLLNVMSLTASSHVIIPTECSYLAMLGLTQLFSTIETVRKYSNKDLIISGLLLIKYSSRANLNQAVFERMEQLAERMGTRVFNSKIRETVKIKEAQSQQSPIIDWDKSCTAVLDYQDFVDELLK